MKIRIWKHKCLGLVLLAFLLLGVLPVQKVKADGGIYVNNKFDLTIVTFNKSSRVFSLYEESIRSIPLENVKVTSSNKSVAAVKSLGWNGEFNQFRLTPKKEGTTKITISATANGKKVNLNGKFNVVKFENPFSMLKINGKNYLSKVKKNVGEGSGGGTFSNIMMKTDKSKFKIQYKLKPGWKITYSNVYGTMINETITMKSGITLPAPKEENDNLGITLELRNNSNGAGMRLQLGTMSIPDNPAL